MPVMVLDVKRGAGRAIADRAIVGAVALAADLTVVPKLSAAPQAKNSMRFIFIYFTFLIIGHHGTDHGC